MAMALNPAVQKKAQLELDTVVGSNRLPEPNDLHDLVYIRAILLEILRWKPIVPLGLPHRLLEDDEYDEYVIPKGTVVFAVSILFLSIDSQRRRSTHRGHSLRRMFGGFADT